MTGGACGSAGGSEEEGSAGRGLGLGRTPSGPPGPRRVEGLGLQPRGRGPAGEGVGWGCAPPACLPPLFGVPQALVDDTEDVSLDFGNEEELAFRKAKIRYVRDPALASITQSCKFT